MDKVNGRKRCIGCEKCAWHWNARLHCKQAIFSLLFPFLALYTCSYSQKCISHFLHSHVMSKVCLV